MTIKEYQKLSTRTLNKDLEKGNQLVNMILGINGEVGELTDLFKKYWFQGHDLNRYWVVGELGDIMFYIINLCTLLGIDMEDVLETNVLKLRKRYPDGFSCEKSINREE